jgi:hypothetical protein
MGTRIAMATGASVAMSVPISVSHSHWVIASKAVSQTNSILLTLNISPEPLLHPFAEDFLRKGGQPDRRDGGSRMGTEDEG